MDQRITKAVLLAFAVCASLSSFTTVDAQQATLTFPDFACGSGIDVEVNLTNPAPHIETGSLLFFDNFGNPMSVKVDGVEKAHADFSLPPGGAKKFVIVGTGQLQLGYALVVAENALSSLAGNLVFIVNRQFDLSIPDSRPTTSARLFVAKDPNVNSGYAVLNRGDQQIDVSLVVRDEKGQQIGEDSVQLAPREKARGFLNKLLGGRQFIGSLEASCDSPFYIIGLRQRTTGSLAALPVAISSGPIVGSQLLFFLDSGIDLTKGGYSQEALEKTVYELTGLTKPANPTGIKIVNNSRNQAVTVHVYFLNDKGQDYFDFLLVLKCGETLTFDPFDFEIPGAAGFRTSNFLFGHGLPDYMDGMFPAKGFASGRFVLSVVAAATVDSNGDNVAELLYPSEVPLKFVCGVTPISQGNKAGIAPGNLHVGNAQPVAFDYLSGNHVYVPAGLDGSAFAADATLKALSAFTRTLVPMPGQNGLVTLAASGNSDLLDYMAGRKGPTAGTVVLPSTAVFTWGSAPFTFLPGGR